ncbi:MAG: hypothetical protein O9325_02860 [Roseomonas sp.]|nr:hypothetical protein [Roseomonas sp.]
MTAWRVSCRFALVAVAGLSVAGCETNQGRLAAQGGAILGGGAAAACFLLYANDAAQRNRCLALAVPAGVVIGGVGGAALGAQQDSFVTAEQELAERTSQARQASAELRAQATNASAAAARISASIEPLRREVNAGRGLTTQQADALASARRDRDAAATALQIGQKQLSDTYAAISRLRDAGQNTSALEEEAQRMEGSNRSLDNSLRRMNTDLGRIEV